MKRLNKKGITLLELIVAMAIFTTIIFIGYSIFNKFIFATNTQGNINKGQLIMNNINNYITTDLEKATGITLMCIEPSSGREYTVENGEAGKEEYLQNAILEIQENNKILINENENKLVYKYIINTSDKAKSVSYTVELSYKKESSYIEYSIYRESRGEPKVDFITSYKTKKKGDIFETPFTITQNNPYKVSFRYEENLNKSRNFEFEVASRDIIGSSSDGSTGPLPETPKPPKPDETPTPPGFKDYGTLGYWTADSSKCKYNNLYTWISDKTTLKGEAYGNQDINQDKFDIEGNLRTQDEAGNESSNIGDGGIWKAQLPNNQCPNIEVNKKVEKISIYVSPYTTLDVSEFKSQDNSDIIIKDSIKIDNKQVINGGTNVNQGVWYECELNRDNINNLIIKGNLSIDKQNVESGYVLVVYGEIEVLETADLIFDYLDLKSGEWQHERSVTYGAGFKNTTGGYTYETTRSMNVAKLDSQQVYIHVKKWVNQVYIRTWGKDGKPEFEINQQNINKKVDNISKLRITMDDNISLSSSNLTLTQKDDVYEIEVIGDSLSLELYFDISKLDTGSFNSGRVCVEFIE